LLARPIGFSWEEKLLEFMHLVLVSLGTLLIFARFVYSGKDRWMRAWKFRPSVK
jgi:hypothetical protein